MKNISLITGQTYQDEDVVFFRNLYQSSFYIFNGAKLIDIYCDKNMKLVFVFLKKDHYYLRKKWLLHNDKYKNKGEVNEQ